MCSKQNKSKNVTMAERGLLGESVWQDALREYPLELLYLIRVRLSEKVFGLNEKFNRSSLYFGYWIGEDKDRLYIYVKKNYL